MNSVPSPGTSSCGQYTAKRQLPAPPPPLRFIEPLAPTRSTGKAVPSTPRATMHTPAPHPRLPTELHQQLHVTPTHQRLLPFNPRIESELSRNQGRRSAGRARRARRATDRLAGMLGLPSTSRAGPSRGVAEGGEASPGRSSRSVRAPPVGSPGRSGRGERRAKYRCDWNGCDASYTTQGDLTCHINEHHYKRADFRCEDCGQAMTRKSRLARLKGSPSCKEKQKKNRR